ncbi:TolC family protein [Flagellimonas marinaquae]
MKKFTSSSTIFLPLLLLGFFLFSSCLLYKDPSKQRTDDLKATSNILENIEVPDDWILQRTDSLTPQFDLNWIKELQDSVLTDLIAEGLAHNSQIIIAQEKLNQIEIALDISGSNLYPSVNAVGGTSTSLNTANNLNSLSFKANWELDIWGKNKSGFEADKRTYFSAKYRYDRLKQSIAALIAKSYFLTIAGSLQQEKFKLLLENTERLRDIINLRREIGTANDLDLSNINLEINQLQGKLVAVDNSLVQAKRALELLLGRYPKGEIATKTDFPRLNNPVPETLPLQLLENRPDILASHYQIESAFLEVQEAKAARLPSLNISSSFGVASSNVKVVNSLFSNPLLNVGGGLVTPIFNGGKLKRNVEIQNSRQKQAVEEYASNVLNALNEVETSWANLHAYASQFSFEDRAKKELENNISLTEKQIEQGISNNYVLLQKKRNLLQNEIGLITLGLNYIVERINLYMALGGNG